MAAHMDSHKKIFCPLCEKNIPKNSKNSHKCNSIDRFLCELCTYESPRKDALKRHMRTHNKEPKEVKTHNCIFCKKTFSKNSHWKEHISTHKKVKAKVGYSCKI